MDNNRIVFRNKSLIIKGIVCGIITCLLINMWVIVSLYFDIKASVYRFMIIPTWLVTWSLISDQTMKKFLLTWVISMGSFMIVEFLVSVSGIIDMVFKHIHGMDAEMWAGDGFGIMVVHLCNFFGSLVGTVFAFITTLVRKIKNNSGNR